MKRKGIIIGIVAGVAFIIGVIVAAILIIISAEPKVEISFETKNNIPSAEMRKIRENLVKVIRDNTSDFDANMIYRGVAKKYNESVFDDSTTANFVVDFDAIKESYKVDVTWPDPDDGSPNVLISCALLNGRYPETPCTTEINSSSDIISYLPYTATLESGLSYTLAADFNDEKLYLEVITDGDISEALADAKKWVASLGFNPNDFQFFVPAGEYIQANHADTNDANVNNNLPYFLPNMFNVYPVVDENKNVTKIKAEIAGCTDAQTDEAEEQILEYLNEHGINYPVDFEYCAE